MSAGPGFGRAVKLLCFHGGTVDECGGCRCTVNCCLYGQPQPHCFRLVHLVLLPLLILLLPMRLLSSAPLWTLTLVCAAVRAVPLFRSEDMTGNGGGEPRHALVTDGTVRSYAPYRNDGDQVLSDPLAVRSSRVHQDSLPQRIRTGSYRPQPGG